MKNTILSLVLGMSLIIGASGCGNAAGTVDPLSLFSDSSLPQLDSITPQSYTFNALTSGFSSANPYWVFTSSGTTGTYLAPAKGIVTSTGVTTLNGTSATYVTIAHSGRLATRIYGMNNLLVRPGDSVVSGQIIGTFVISGSVGFQVLLDGSPVCPLSFMSTTFRQNLSTFYGNGICL